MSTVDTNNEEHGHSEHHEGCCCHGHCSTASGCGHSENRELPEVSDAGMTVLLALEQCGYLPVSRFIMCSSTEEAVRIVSLAPVYIESAADTMALVKDRGAVLTELAEKNLISLDYDIPLQGYDYEQHTKSELFLYFMETVKEGTKRPDFLCDKAEIELGSMALTEYGDLVTHLLQANKD